MNAIDESAHPSGVVEHNKANANGLFLSFKYFFGRKRKQLEIKKWEVPVSILKISCGHYPLHNYREEIVIISDLYHVFSMKNLKLKKGKVMIIIYVCHVFSTSQIQIKRKGKKCFTQLHWRESCCLQEWFFSRQLLHPCANVRVMIKMHRRLGMDVATLHQPNECLYKQVRIESNSLQWTHIWPCLSCTYEQFLVEEDHLGLDPSTKIKL